MNRRDFNRLAIRGAAGLATGAGLSSSLWPVNSAYAATSDALSLDGMEIQVLRDGAMSMPASFLLSDLVPEDDRQSFMKAQGWGDEPLQQDCNVTLLRTEDRVVLFDVGGGFNFMPTLGELGDSLAEHDLDPADVTDVVFTHAHPDHLWGLLDDFDDLLFSEANYYISQAEWEYWRDDNTMSRTPENRQSFVVGAQSRLAMLEDRINLFQFGSEVLPGVEAIDSSGHTPGHSCFAIHSGSDSVVILGDAIANAAISFQKPEWPYGSDQDKEAGIQTRLRLFDRLVADKSAIVGFHLPHPGAGHVEADGAAYRFVPG